MTVLNPELHLWTIEDWSCFHGDYGGSFKIWVSPKFLETASEAKHDEETSQKTVRSIIKRAGYKVSESERFLQFGKFGLMHFSIPGMASGMDISYNESDVLKKGAEFVAHNVDSLLQQSLLMAIWMMWANFIESQIWRKKEKKE